MILKPNEIENSSWEIDKEEARELLSKGKFNGKRFSDSKLIDRFNLEGIMQRFFKGHVTVRPDLHNRNLNIKIGYAFNYCYPEPLMEKNVTENILEIPILKEFLARGCMVKFLGSTSVKFNKFHNNLEDFSSEWKKLPKQYLPVESWIEDCVSNYEDKYEVEFPDVDFVIMNVFPAFVNTNMMFYLLNLHYAKKGIPVFLWDIEYKTLASNAKSRDKMKKAFKFSGADKLFSEEQFKEIAANSYWLEQIPGEVLSRAKKFNPDIRIIPFFPPYWFRDDIGMYRPRKKVEFRTMYIGNDSERRNTFKKYFTHLSEKNHLTLFGGGMSQRAKGYDGFDSGTIDMQGEVQQVQVWRKYNFSRTCLSLARQRYYNVGFIVHRWLEVVLGGSILLLPKDLYGVEKYFKDYFIVNDLEDFEDKINYFNDRIKPEAIMRCHNYQKKFIYKFFSSERDVDAILRVIGR